MKTKTINTLILLAFVAGISAIGCKNNSSVNDEKVSGEEIAELAYAPLIPKPITRTHPTHVIVDLTIVERIMKLADSTDYMFWTFGGAVPGQFIRVRQG